MAEPQADRRRVLPHRARQTLLTAHIMMSVALLGDSAAFLALSIRAARSTDPSSVIEIVNILKMLSAVFGIPLSFGALLSGIALGLGTKWGVFRYPWVIAKLLLIVSVMAVGGLFIGPGQAAILAGTRDATGQLIAAASYDVLALSVATALGVFKPGRRLRG